jgi:hypothetical protein
MFFIILVDVEILDGWVVGYLVWWIVAVVMVV